MTLTQLIKQEYHHKEVKNFIYDLLMQCDFISHCNQNVIYISKNHTWIFSLDGYEYLIYKSLKCGWQVCKSQKHYLKFKDTTGGLEDCFPLVFIPYLDIMVSPADIQGSKQYITFQFFQDLLYLWNWVNVMHCPKVNYMVILQRVKFSILFPYKEPWGRSRGASFVAFFNISKYKVFVQEFLYHNHLLLCQ